MADDAEKSAGERGGRRAGKASHATRRAAKVRRVGCDDSSLRAEERVLLATLTEPPYVYDVRALLRKTLACLQEQRQGRECGASRPGAGDSPPRDTVASALKQQWEHDKFGYVYYSMPRDMKASDFLQCLYQATIEAALRPAQVMELQTPDGGDDDASAPEAAKLASRVALALLFLLYECQPRRHSDAQVKVRVDPATWRSLREVRSPFLAQLCGSDAFLFVVAAEVRAMPAPAPSSTDQRTKRTLLRVHAPPSFGYALDGNGGEDGGAESDKRAPAEEMARVLTRAGQLMDMGSDFADIDSACRSYRISKAKLRSMDIGVPALLSPSFAVDAQKRFEPFR